MSYVTKVVFKLCLLKGKTMSGPKEIVFAQGKNYVGRKTVMLKLCLLNAKPVSGPNEVVCSRQKLCQE